MGLTHAPTAPLLRIQPDALVLGTREIRRDVSRSATSRFADDVWDLTPALIQDHQKWLVLDFASVAAAYRDAAKELSYALLACKPPTGARPLKVVTIRGHFISVKRFLGWLSDPEQGKPVLCDVTPELLLSYKEVIIAAGGAMGRRDQKRRSVRLLWIYRQHLHARNQLSFDPLLLEEWNEGGKGRPGRENATPRIPESVVGPLLVWALRFIDDFSEDILRAAEEWDTLHTRTPRSIAAGRGARARLEILLNRYTATGRPLPGGSTGPSGINLRHFAREVDCSTRSVTEPGARRLIYQTADEVGVSSEPFLWTECSAMLDGRPWTGPIPVRELPNLVRLLQTAAYIVVAYLSGMRDSEVKHLRRGCLTVDRDSTGRICRRKITSQAFKGEGTPLGARATWIVGDPVVRAIAVLERIQPPQQKRLFAIPPSSQHFRSATATRVKSTRDTNEDLNHFSAWVTDYCTGHGRRDGLPLVSGRSWLLRTSQFRRTLAWFIARRPGGTIAGAIQYRHVSTQMFEGYAGTTRSGFRAEAQQEEALARGERLAALVEGHGHEELRGPSAEEAAHRLEKFGDRVRFMGKTPDEAQMHKIMRRDDPRIYPGKFVTCSDNPDRRLCRQPTDTSSEPSLGDCKPLACKNVALTADNIGAWQNHLARLNGQLTLGDALAPLVHVRMTQRRDEVAAFLTEQGIALAAGEQR